MICIALALGSVVHQKPAERGALAKTLAELHAAHSSFLEAVAHARGILLRGDASDSAAFRGASARTTRYLDQLEEAAFGDPAAVDQAERLRTLIESHSAAIQSAVNLGRAGRRDAALQQFADADSRAPLEDVTGAFARLARTIEEGAKNDQTETGRAAFHRAAALVAAGICALALLAWSYRRVTRELARHYVASLEAERQREILSVTLASIGDAVVITDTSGRITFINRVTEQLTGWSALEAEGKPSAEVFRIVAEDHRRPLPDPVSEVLREGRAATVPAGTLLIRRDGSVLAVNDSAAPIREPDGTVRGVVLVFQDFSTRREVERNLLATQRELEEAASAKDRFLAMLSHELRTPLTPILATLSDWEINERLPPERRKELAIVRSNVRVQARLIDDLLDLSRVVHGKLQLAPEPLDIHPLLEATRELYEEPCRNRGIHLSLSPSASDSHIRGDPARLRQILWNVVGNAVKFCTRGDRILITSSNPEPGLLRVEMEDSGAGMTASTMARLFEPFIRGAESAAERGLGLGLPIARALVEAQGGRLRAESAGLGAGSRFSLEFPAIAPPNVTRRVPAPSLSGPQRILLVEDHADTVDVLTAILEKLGHSVRAGRSIAEGEHLVREAEFDLVLCDVGLPDGTGIEFLRILRRSSAAPAIALTGYGAPADVERCLAAGFSAHLTKPVDMDHLDAVIRRTVAANEFRLPASP